MRFFWTMLLALVTLTFAVPVVSEVMRFDSFERNDREFSVQMGYGTNIHIPRDTEDNFLFDAIKFRYGIFTSPRTQLAFDASTGVNRPGDSNPSFWGTIGYRRFFAVRGSTAFGYDFDFGLMRFQDGARSLSTRINFTEQIGILMQHAVSKRTAVAVEYKFAHVSNAGVRLPNIGINLSTLYLGYYWYN